MTGEPTSKIAKVGLLTYKDYITVRNDNNTNYLNKGTYWWLGTGYSSYAFFAWFVGESGDASGVNVCSGLGVRPAVVLNSGITITRGNGSSENPYTIE